MLRRVDASDRQQKDTRKEITKMAVLAAAALLDELMGRNRNIAPNDKAKELNWEDPEISLSPAQTQKNEEQIKFLTEKINSLVGEAEQMGIQGNVEQAQGLMKLCDQLKEEREQLRGNNENSHWQQTAELAAAQEKQMEVCDVCGAFLIVGDAQQRIDDHLMGKQHVGYARLKMAMEELINNRQKSRDDKERRREEERRERTRLREEEERKRDRERDREREERRRKREEEERRNRPKHRSRSPRYRRRSTSRSHSRTRKGSRERDFAKRSGKEERGKSSRNSRSKSRDRNRDYKRKPDDHERDHHRRANKDRGLNGDYGRHSSPSHRPSSRHHQESKLGRSSGGADGGRGDE
ncbi:hypothetical protein C0J52_03176 [Blattella germanica]|nr:hypothetical protein C0J52_03176 [Blattella germanica]